uniref:B3 domain-containing protein At1g49475 family n=1 Tax=Cajanus cajan TaxID=3821 RepID=A0A151S4J0_CAJCA|nr:B3 domain-containing protein At1g49475 family [Cajanus cajan]
MFVSKYGKYLSSTMFLKLPNGAEWRVNLEKINGSVWFQKGWDEFVKHHSLAHGHLLIFRYDGASHFHVLICDMSGTEIEYPINKANHKRARIKSEEIQHNKIRRTNGYNKKGKRKIEGSSISKYGVLEAVNTSFTVIMKASHLIRQCMLMHVMQYLPKGPLKSFIKSGEQYVMLLVGDRSWRVKLSHYHNKSSSYFTAQWPAFARDNDLKEGDACLFQLLNSSDDLVMKVSISRYSSLKRPIT